MTSAAAQLQRSSRGNKRGEAKLSATQSFV